jgi:hypothetical protein
MTSDNNLFPVAPTHDIPVPFARADPRQSSPRKMTKKSDTEKPKHSSSQSAPRLALALTKQQSRDLMPIPQLPRSVQFRHSTILLK